MHLKSTNPIFENRYDAGKKLAEKLLEYKKQPVVVLAIPNGGIPVAHHVALELNANMDLIISRKIPIPLAPEGGFGAVTDDGTVILNPDVLKRINLNESQINYQVSRVRNDIQQRSIIYRSSRPVSVLASKIAIVVDDGLASGYTMMAAIESVRRKKPKVVIAAVPVASAVAIKQVEKVADKVITVAIDYSPRFYVSDYYRYWNVLNDREGLDCYNEWHRRKYQANIDTNRPGHNPPPSSY
jgi:putative phosphoribosyl transferase